MSSESQALPQAQQLPLQELPAFVAHEQNAALCCQRGAEHRELKSKIAVSVNLWLIRDKKEDSNSEDVKDGKAMAWLFFWVRFAFFCVWFGMVGFFLHNSGRAAVVPQCFITVKHGARPGEGEASRMSSSQPGRPAAQGKGSSSTAFHSPATPRPRLGSDFFYRQHGNKKGK